MRYGELKNVFDAILTTTILKNSPAREKIPVVALGAVPAQYNTSYSFPTSSSYNAAC